MKKIIRSLLVMGTLAGGMVKASEGEYPVASATTDGSGGGSGVLIGEEFNRKETLDLITAASRGDLNSVQRLVTDYPYVVNAKNNIGDTALHWAADSGNLRVVIYLITAGAKVNTPNEEGYTPLHNAASSGHLPVVEYLLTVGASVNTYTKRKMSPLHNAAYGGHSNIARALLDAGADVNAQNEDGRTALHWAAFEDHLDVVEVLVAARAVKVNTQDNEGTAVLHWAAWFGRLSIVKFLLTRPEVNLELEDFKCKTAEMIGQRSRAPEIADLIRAEITVRRAALTQDLSASALASATGGGGTAGAGDATA